MVVDLEDYSLARVIKGIYDSEYKTIATDDEGNIIGVFKGEYNEELITIKTDSSGRMLAIITDPEDVYGNIHMVGNAELAARLGSINMFERRGNTVWMDDFESPSLKWAETTVGDGNTKEYTTARAFTGSTSMKLTTAATEDNVMGIQKKFIPPSDTKIGLEARVFCETANTLVDMIIYGRAADYLYWGRVRWDFTARTLGYEKEAGGYTTLKTSTFNDTGVETWVPIKLVIDYDTLKYVRVLFGKDKYEIPTQGLPSLSIAGVDSITIGVDAKAKADAVAEAYVDNVIFTQNEP